MATAPASPEAKTCVSALAMTAPVEQVIEALPEVPPLKVAVPPELAVVVMLPCEEITRFLEVPDSVVCSITASPTSGVFSSNLCLLVPINSLSNNTADVPFVE